MSIPARARGDPPLAAGRTEKLHGAHLFAREVRAAVADDLRACGTTIEDEPIGVVS
jgi:hypothetical protein